MAIFADMFGKHNWEKGDVLSASSGWRPGKLVALALPRTVLQNKELSKSKCLYAAVRDIRWNMD